MTGSHEVRGSIPLGSTKHFNLKARPHALVFSIAKDNAPMASANSLMSDSALPVIRWSVTIALQTGSLKRLFRLTGPVFTGGGYSEKRKILASRSPIIP